MNVLEGWGLHLPTALINAPFGKGEEGFLALTGAIVNLPAVFIVLVLGAICYIGVRESSAANTAMVMIKVAVIVLFIGAGLAFVDTSN